MEVLLLVLGLGLVAAAGVDALWTALWVDGRGGPVTRVVLAANARITSVLAGLGPRWPPSLAGPLSIVMTIGGWVVLTWTGWWLVFLSEPGAVVEFASRSEAGALDRLYFAASTVFTLGYGDFVPVGLPWKIATGFAALHGLALVTLGITYVVSVLHAVVERRTLAHRILNHGRSPQDLLLAAWAGTRFDGLEGLLSRLADDVLRAAENDVAYPILNEYRADDVQRSLSVAVVVLDEAVTLLRTGVDAKVCPPVLVLRAASRAVDAFFAAMDARDVAASEALPSPPDRLALGAAGVPLVDEEVFRAALVPLAERRRRLLGRVEAEGRPWPGAAAPRPNVPA